MLEHDSCLRLLGTGPPPRSRRPLLGPRDTHQVLVVGVGHGHAGQEEQSGHVLHVVGRVDRRGLRIACQSRSINKMVKTHTRQFGTWSGWPVGMVNKDIRKKHLQKCAKVF